MNPVDFPQANIRIAEKQEEYTTLPAYLHQDNMGTVTHLWQPTKEELDLLNKGYHIQINQATFGHPLQPMSVDVAKDIDPATCTVIIPT